MFIIKTHQDRNSSRKITWKQELMHRPWRVLIPDMLLLECPYFFHITLRTNSPGLAPPTMTGPSRINHYLRKYLRAGSYVVIFSIEVSFFQSLGVK